MLYQRISLATGDPVGDPAPLPREFQGSMTDADLARVGEVVARELSEYSDAGFVPYTPPAPEPAPVIRWLHKAIVLQRIPAEKRIAVRMAAKTDPIIEDFLDLLRQTDQVDLDNANLIQGFGYLVQLELMTAEDVAAVRADP